MVVYMPHSASSTSLLPLQLTHWAKENGRGWMCTKCICSLAIRRDSCKGIERVSRTIVGDAMHGIYRRAQTQHVLVTFCPEQMSFLVSYLYNIYLYKCKRKTSKKETYVKKCGKVEDVLYASFCVRTWIGLCWKKKGRRKTSFDP